jgi:tRNA threonylcarbamoyladenosine biosynthesis protein TsaB
MRILGIDTATTTTNVALIEDGQLLAEEIYSSRRSPSHCQILVSKANHAEAILPLIDAVLRKAAASLQTLSAIAVSIGPGSFTGLRVGVSTVKGLAYGLGIPVVGVSTLLANAARVNDFDGLICSFLDARKGEVYSALFRRNGEALIRLTEDEVADAANVVDRARSLCGDGTCLFIGSGATTYEKLLMNALGDKGCLSAGDGYPSLASAAARLSENRTHSTESLGSLVPVYLSSRRG